MKKKVIAIFVFSWSMLTLLSSGIVESQDGLQYLTIARQMYYHNSLAMPQAKYPANNIHMNVQTGRNGEEFSPTGLGYSLALLPSVALEDVFNRRSEVRPTSNFPLDNDWPIMLFASMTNAFFGALLITTSYLYLKTFSFTDTRSFSLSVLLFISSNLLVYSKHAFAHQMFISFMWVSFYFIRRYRLSKNTFNIVFAALSYGVVLLSYNPTYLLPLPALGIYYLFSLSYTSVASVLKVLVKDALVALLAISPFLLLYSWFNWIRFGGAISTGYGDGAISVPPIPPAFVFFEGLWGILFSPGKSIFLFTPILLLLVLFWFKFKKSHLPELVSFLALLGVYTMIIASLFSGPDFFPWHGEASFGPRYMLPILPFVILLAALLHRELSSVYRKLVFWPIVFIGISIQLVGVLIPYQVRFAGLEYQYTINGHRITYDTYANFLPRFSPLYSMSKWLVKTVILIPQYYFTSPKIYFIDGIHGILPTNEGNWREIETTSALRIDTGPKASSVELEVLNSVATTSGQRYPINISAFQSEQELTKVVAEPEQRARITLPTQNIDTDQPIVLKVSYEGTDSARLANQHTFITGIFEDSQSISLVKYSYPYVSNITSMKYYYWGNENIKLWDLWQMRSINYVHTFDLWWLRPFHYWDLPKQFFFLLWLGNVTILLGSGVYLRKSLSSQS